MNNDVEINADKVADPILRERLREAILKCMKRAQVSKDAKVWAVCGTIATWIGLFSTNTALFVAGCLVTMSTFVVVFVNFSKWNKDLVELKEVTEIISGQTTQEDGPSIWK